MAPPALLNVRPDRYRRPMSREEQGHPKPDGIADPITVYVCAALLIPFGLMGSWFIAIPPGVIGTVTAYYLHRAGTSPDSVLYRTTVAVTALGIVALAIVTLLTL